MIAIKVKGIVEEEKGTDSCRIRVVAFKKNGEYVSNGSEIKAMFPPYGFVFAPSFFKKTDHPLQSFIEFSVRPNDRSKSDNDDALLLDSNKGCRLTGFPLYELPQKALSNEGAMDQPFINDNISTDASHFYIKIDQYLYGPLKKDQENIIPVRGREVEKFNIDQRNVLNLENQSFLITQPNSPICKIDCMTPYQLGDWIRTYLNAFSKMDIPTIKKALDIQMTEDLENARLKRALSNLSHLELFLDDLRLFCTLSPDYKIQYDAAFARVRDEVEDAVITPITQQKDQLETEVRDLMARRNQLDKDATALELSNLGLRQDITYLTTEQDRLTKDIRLRAIIEPSIAHGAGRLKTWEEQEYSSQLDPYEQLHDFTDAIKELSELKKCPDLMTHLFGIIYQLQEYRCFLCADLNIPRLVARLTSNAKVFIQQAEVDWIKFESFFHNGLEEAWNSAFNQPGKFHFFLLQDFNISSIECYARPLLDVLENFRRKLPGTSLGWPRNFWLFTSSVQCKNTAGEPLGLNLSKFTFRKWSGLKKMSMEIRCEPPELPKFLPLDLVFGHFNVTPNEMEGYFNEI